MNTSPENKLARIASRLKATMNASASGPLLVAEEIVGLSQNWENYRTQADGKDCTTWLTTEVTHPGQGLAFFAIRARAVKVLGGRANVHRLDHYAAVWLARDNIPEGYRVGIMTEVHRLYRGRNNGSCVTKGQVVRIAARIMKKVPTARVCQRCLALEAQIKKMGGVVEE